MASGANTAVIPRSQAIAKKIGRATALPPSISPRVASTTLVMGLTFTNPWSHPGIDEAGANTELWNVTGRGIMKPPVFPASGAFPVAPRKATGRHTATPNGPAEATRPPAPHPPPRKHEPH